MDALTLVIVTPKRLMLETRAQWVEVPAASGWMRALPGHAATLGGLGAGLLRYQDAGDAGRPEARLVVCGGFFEIRDDKVTLLADVAELPSEISLQHAEAELRRLQHLAPPPAQHELDLAMARLAAIA